jgi:hypothetical protein
MGVSGYAYQGPGYPEAQAVADFGGTFPAQVDAYVTVGAAPALLASPMAHFADGQTVGLFQAVDDAANPGQQTIRLLGTKAVAWGRTAKFSAALTPPAQGGHGLVVFSDYDQSVDLQVRAPPGVTVPASSPAGQPVVQAGQVGSAVNAQPPEAPTGNHRLRNAFWVGALALLVVGLGITLWQVAAHKAAQKALGGG